MVWCQTFFYQYYLWFLFGLTKKNIVAKNFSYISFQMLIQSCRKCHLVEIMLYNIISTCMEEEMKSEFLSLLYWKYMHMKKRNSTHITIYYLSTRNTYMQQPLAHRGGLTFLWALGYFSIGPPLRSDCYFSSLLHPCSAPVNLDKPIFLCNWAKTIYLELLFLYVCKY
jgi:hypothetical protein